MYIDIPKILMDIGAQKKIINLDVPEKWKDRWDKIVIGKLLFQSMPLTRLCQNFELTEKQEDLGEITRFTFFTGPGAK